MEKEVFCYLIKIVTTTNNEIVVKHIVKKILEIISVRKTSIQKNLKNTLQMWVRIKRDFHVEFCLSY